MLCRMKKDFADWNECLHLREVKVCLNAACMHFSEHVITHTNVVKSQVQAHNLQGQVPNFHVHGQVQALDSEAQIKALE